MVFLVLNLVISLLLANGLRKGYKLAWWFAIILPTLLVLVVLLLLVVAVISVFAPDADIELIGMPQIIASVAALSGPSGGADRRAGRVPGPAPWQAPAGLRHLQRRHSPRNCCGAGVAARSPG